MIYSMMSIKIYLKICKIKKEIQNNIQKYIKTNTILKNMNGDQFIYYLNILTKLKFLSIIK